MCPKVFKKTKSIVFLYLIPSSEKEKKCVYVCVCMHVYIKTYTHICTYIRREKERLRKSREKIEEKLGHASTATFKII